MVKWSKESILSEGGKVFSAIAEWLDQRPELCLSQLDPKRTALIIVDMINGFAREGALQSPRVEKIIAPIVCLTRACQKAGIPVLAFADSHGEMSPEFRAYPPHCLAGTNEAELVDELKALGGYRLFLKNSVNGFLETEFQQWLKEHQAIDQYLVVGDCTDICIQQLAVTLKAWFNMNNRESRVIVPVNAVDTFDGGLHHGDLMHEMALFMMSGNGVEIVGRIVEPEGEG